MPATPAQYARASYSGSPWTAVNGVNLTEATNPPATGASVGGFTPADFNGTSQKLGGSAFPVANLAGAWTFACLVYVDTLAAEQANEYSDANLFIDDNGAVGLAINDGGGTPKIEFFAYNAGYTVVNLTTASWGTGAWKLVFVRVDGVANTVEGGTNGDTLASGACDGNYDLSAAVLRVGTDYTAGGAFLDGKVLEHIFWSTGIANADRTKLRKYCQQRYGVSV